jgi:hypothetical protein
MIIRLGMVKCVNFLFPLIDLFTQFCTRLDDTFFHLFENVGEELIHVGIKQPVLVALEALGVHELTHTPVRVEGQLRTTQTRYTPSSQFP